MSFSQSSFSKLKPLPGDKDYGLKKSEVLQVQTEQMGKRLEYLKLQVEEERIQREKTKLIGGSRWRSARETKGSIRNYAKDVRERQKVNKVKKKTRPLSQETIKQKMNYDIRDWDNDRVLKWLISINLEIYCNLFKQNQISGNVLLDIGEEDLDYMKITLLSHRKQILKAIADFKENLLSSPSPSSSLPPHSSSLPPHSSSLPPPSSSLPPPSSSTISSPSPPSSIQSLKPKKTLIHWSQAKPLSENVIVNSENSFINLADGEYNEIESHESFLKALLQWRDNDEQDKLNLNNNGMWINPNEKVHQVPHIDTQGGNLGLGCLNEEKEHEEFLKAVEAWRKGSSNIKQEKIHAVAASTDYHQQKLSCWECYSLIPEELAFNDKITRKKYCSEKCAKCFTLKYSDFYKKGDTIAENS